MIPPHLLSRIPGCSDGAPPLAVEPLPGGQGRNVVVRVETALGRFVMRQRLAPVNRPGALALTELRAHRLAAGAGLAPPILDAADDGSWILMEHVDAPPWSPVQLESQRGLERLGGFLRKLHAQAIPVDLPVADAPAMARGYVERLRHRDPVSAAALQPLVDQVTRQSAVLAPSARRVLVHGDLTASNILGATPILVDWEYAQAADPGWDFACLLSYYPALEPALGPLLAAAGIDDAQARERFRLERQRFGLLNRLWDQAYPAGRL
jgi:aminoglycoside phosphotransferase (APT) family kinase protein